MSEVSIWHVVWTTWGSSLDWRVLQARRAVAATSHDAPLPAPLYSEQRETSSILALDEAACRQIENDIRELTAPGGDRIAGNTLVFAVAARNSRVELVLRWEEARLQQVVGRLKSRTATLLSFVRAHGLPGKQTWSTGFGRIRCLDEEAVRQAIDMVKALGHWNGQDENLREVEGQARD
jgi:hypothetical protein